MSWLTTVADTLRAYGDDEAVDVAEVIAHVGQAHAERAGWCEGCGEEWPCVAYRDADQLALTYLIRGANQAAAKAAETIARHSRGDAA